MKSSITSGRWKALLCALGLLITACGTGCQVSVGGQTLPSPFYLQDDVQPASAGPEFKLWEEAAALKAFKAEQELLDQ